MRIHHWTAILLFLLLPGKSLADLQAPTCEDLAAWAGDFKVEPQELIAPGVKLPEAVSDTHISRMFGAPIRSWTRVDFGTFNQRLNHCQRSLFKTDRTAAKQLNRVRKQFKGVARSVKQLADAAQQASLATDQLLALPNSANTNDLLGTAQAALAGDDVRSQIRTLPRDAQRPLVLLVSAQRNLSRAEAGTQSKRLNDRLTELGERPQTQPAARSMSSMSPEQESRPPAMQAAQGRERSGAGSQQAQPVVDSNFTETTSAELAGRVERLQRFEFTEPSDLGVFWQEVSEFGRLLNDPRNAEAAATAGIDAANPPRLGKTFADAAKAVLPTFEQQVAAVPANQAGLQQLKTLVQDATGVVMRSTAMQPYYQAVQHRANTISTGLREAAAWLPVEPRLEALVIGDEVESVTLGGLHPGMGHAQSVRLIRRTWGFEPATTLDLGESYGPARGKRSHLDQERRDGGILTVESVERKLGQLVFREHYMAKLKLRNVHGWLLARLGKPDSEQATPIALTLTWSDGDRRLQVRARNQAEGIHRATGYKSQLGVAVWNKDYDEHLDALNERCDEIRKLSRNQQSMQQSLFFAANCSFKSGTKINAGL